MGQIQADVILLGFPLMYNMTKQVRANDLNFYSAVTDPDGPAMTWAMTAIGYLEIGQYATAQSYFLEGYANAQPPFQVWTETPTGVRSFSHYFLLHFISNLSKGNCQFHHWLRWLP